MLHLPKLLSNTDHLQPDDWEFEFLGLSGLPRVVALTGSTKSGKTIVAKRLATEYGFFYVNLGSILAKIASTMGETDLSNPLDLSAQQLGKFGRNLRKQRGPDILAKVAFRMLKNQDKPADKIVLDSLLHPKEIEFFRKRSNFTLIGVEAAEAIRIEELLGWANLTLDVAKRILIERDQFEQYHINRNDEFSPCIDACLEMVDKPDWLVKIETAMTHETVYRPIDHAMERLSDRWSLKRLVAPVSNNNFPYWHQTYPNKQS